ncbi:MAG: hypothetical protein NZ518_02690, partial [Dehalococcoidia bacterium]|nr:hypothetical protein [Dehalococcoidia bacterium]
AVDTPDAVREYLRYVAAEPVDAGRGYPVRVEARGEAWAVVDPATGITLAWPIGDEATAEEIAAVYRTAEIPAWALPDLPRGYHLRRVERAWELVREGVEVERYATDDYMAAHRAALTDLGILHADLTGAIRVWSIGLGQRAQAIVADADAGQTLEVSSISSRADAQPQLASVGLTPHALALARVIRTAHAQSYRAVRLEPGLLSADEIAAAVATVRGMVERVDGSTIVLATRGRSAMALDDLMVEVSVGDDGQPALTRVGAPPAGVGAHAYVDAPRAVQRMVVDTGGELSIVSPGEGRLFGLSTLGTRARAQVMGDDDRMLGAARDHADAMLRGHDEEQIARATTVTGWRGDVRVHGGVLPLDRVPSEPADVERDDEYDVHALAVVPVGREQEYQRRALRVATYDPARESLRDAVRRESIRHADLLLSVRYTAQRRKGGMITRGMRAIEEATEEDRLWYDIAVEYLYSRFGRDLEMFVAILAATSQNRRVDQNVTDALKVWDALSKGTPIDRIPGILSPVRKQIARAVVGLRPEGPKISEFNKEAVRTIADKRNLVYSQTQAMLWGVSIRRAAANEGRRFAIYNYPEVFERIPGAQEILRDITPVSRDELYRWLDAVLGDRINEFRGDVARMVEGMVPGTLSSVQQHLDRLAAHRVPAVATSLAERVYGHMMPPTMRRWSGLGALAKYMAGRGERQMTREQALAAVRRALDEVSVTGADIVTRDGIVLPYRVTDDRTVIVRSPLDVPTAMLVTRTAAELGDRVVLPDTDPAVVIAVGESLGTLVAPDTIAVSDTSLPEGMLASYARPEWAVRTPARDLSRSEIMRTRLRPYVVKALTRSQIVDLARGVFPNAAPEIFERHAREMEAFVSRQNEGMYQIAKRWSDLVIWHKRDAALLADVMHMATIHNFDPAEHKPVNRAQRDVLEMWKSLGQEAKEIYIMARDAYRLRGRQLMEALEQRVLKYAGADSEGASAMIAKLRQQFERLYGDGVYFPLARFGTYTLLVKRETGNEFYMFENPADRQRVYESLIKSGVPKDRIYAAKTFRGAARNLGISEGFVAQMLDRLSGRLTKEEIDDIWQ